MPECAPPDLEPRLVAWFWSWRVIGCLSSPGDWVLGVEGREAGIRPGVAERAAERWSREKVKRF